jgi:PIN domain nuclease of toxin-antitoxin system
MMLLSLASIWKMQIKNQLGKLTFRRPLPDIIESQQRANGLKLLPVELKHIYGLSTLPNHHKDPFDRLLIAQAKIEDIAVVSVDTIFPQYPVKVLGGS